MRRLCSGKPMVVCGVLLAIVAPSVVRADGVEGLGPPEGIEVAHGSGVVAAGTGLFTQPGSIVIDVPSNATVEQVFLYWYGRGTPDDTINIRGTSVSGTNIGSVPSLTDTGPSTVYRADITNLDIVRPGSNVLEVSGLDFSYHNSGAGLLVIYDDRTRPAIIHLRDGHDFASLGLASPFDDTVPQAYSFPAEPEDRIVNLILFIADGEPDRPDAIDITVGGVTTTYLNEIASRDGDEWDTIPFEVVLPAGETEITVHLRSVEDPLNGTPDSFCWVAAVAWLQVDELPPVLEGCAPAYWAANPTYWATYSSTDRFNTVFGVTDPDNATLMQTLETTGTGRRALGRAAVAALLNASHPGVYYFYTEQEVIDRVREAYATGDYAWAKSLFDIQNQEGCPPLTGPSDPPRPPQPPTPPSNGDDGGEPGSGDPGSGDPGSGDPGSGDPGSGDPGSGDPGSGDPGSGDPGGSGGTGGTGGGGGGTTPGDDTNDPPPPRRGFGCGVGAGLPVLAMMGMMMFLPLRTRCRWAR